MEIRRTANLIPSDGQSIILRGPDLELLDSTRTVRDRGHGSARKYIHLTDLSSRPWSDSPSFILDTNRFSVLRRRCYPGRAS